MPARPLYMVTGDLNSDGLDDVVVVSPASRTMAVFLAAEEASEFAPAVTYPLESDKVQFPGLGDLNGDAVLDVAIPVVTEGAIRIFFGNGDGTFTRVLPEPRGFASPTAVAIADIARRGDMLVAERGGRVVLAVNNGATPRLTFTLDRMPCAGGECRTGPRPDRIWTLDLNQDTKPDFVTLDVGGARVKSVSLSLYQKGADFLYTNPRQYLFGSEPSSPIVTDVNGDGVPDLVGITQDIGKATSNITILRGVSDGTFGPPATFAVSCPYFVGTASCRGLALSSGDYNGDGDVDLAMALNDPRGEATGSAQDALLILVGQGNGTFKSGPVIPIGKGVLGLVSGDVGGDVLPDVVVSSTRVMSVQAFVNRSTTGDLGNGEQCVFGDECASSRCIDDVCCATACAEGERCNVPGREGVCQPIPVDPVQCERPDECDPEFCINGYCCENACVGGRCDVAGYEGLCIEGRPNGETCDDDTQCASMICSDNFVCCNERCEDGFCDERGICRPLLDLGDQCNIDQECASAICDVFNGICCAERCDAVTEDCNPEGQCVPFDVTQTPNVVTVTPTPRTTPAPNGELCSVEGDCLSTFCVNDVCCEVSSCGANEHCAEGSGQCVSGGTPTRTFTPTRIPTATPANPCEPNPCPSGQKCITQNGGPVCVATSSSSGCSTTDGGGSGHLLVLASMPFFLWAARRWQRKRARVRTK